MVVSGSAAANWQPVMVGGPPACHPAAAVEVAVGTWSSCARLDDGTVRCWGSGREGQLGDGGHGARSFPAVVRGVTNARRLRAGDDRFCAVMDDQRVRCWGDGVTRPQAVPALAGVVDIAFTSGAVVARDAGGQILQHAWREPADLPPIATARLWAGGSTVCAEGPGGQLACGGRGPWPALLALAGPPPVRALELGPFGACAVTAAGRVACIPGPHPRQDWLVASAARLTGVDAVALEYARACATGAGKLWCWDRHTDPALVDLPAVAEVQLGAQHTCARTRDGRVFCWGANSRGQLGDATTTARAAPTAVAWCPAAAVAPEVPKPAAPLLARLTRTGGCDILGACPVYTVEVYDDGTARYQGDLDTAVAEGRRRTLSGEELSRLRAAFDAAGFASLSPPPHHVTDVSTLKLSLATPAGLHTVLVPDSDDPGAPATVRALAARLDELLGTAALVGPRSPHR
jgi:hypothetical protein